MIRVARIEGLPEFIKIMGNCIKIYFKNSLVNLLLKQLPYLFKLINPCSFQKYDLIPKSLPLKCVINSSVELKNSESISKNASVF